MHRAPRLVRAAAVDGEKGAACGLPCLRKTQREAELRGTLLHVPLQFGVAVVADIPSNLAIGRTEPLHFVSKQPSVVIVGPI